MNESPVNTADMIPIERIDQSNMDYAEEVIKLSEKAKNYLDSMEWCIEIIKGWLNYASGYIIGVFYFEIIPSRNDIPRFIWVIVGDLPPAYLDVEYCSNGREAIEGYISEMQEWVDRVLKGHPIDDTVIPVNVPAEKKWAEALRTRLKLIKELML